MITMDINKIIFSRTAPRKKVEIVKNLTGDEPLFITLATVLRMVREAGSRLYRSREKKLTPENSVSNDWNAEFVSVRSYRLSLIAEIYLQYDNTDTSISVSLADFLKERDYSGSITREDRYGNPRTFYFTFTESQKAECVKSLLLTYLHIRYKGRLDEN